MKKQIVIGHLFTLLLGCFIYISFRKDTLIIFNWLDRINALKFISDYRLFTISYSDNLPNWFLYSLPDGLWLFSYISVLLAFWDNTISKHNIHWILLVPILAIFMEFFQLFYIKTGTFDILDIIFYLLGTLLPILIFTNFKINKYEKND